MRTAAAARLRAHRSKLRQPPVPRRSLLTSLRVRTCRWQENDFGLDPASKRCAVADGLEKPWCYFGTGDGDWEYCDDSCREPAPPPPAAGQCSVSVTGKECDAWGENDFGLDPSSNTCEQVDGLDRPWCYTSGEDWDYCDCAKENEGAAPKPSSTAKPRSTAPKVLEPGCDDDRAENKALQDQVAQFKRNKRALEIESEFSVRLESLAVSISTDVPSLLCTDSGGAATEAERARSRSVTAEGDTPSSLSKRIVGVYGSDRCIILSCKAVGAACGSKKSVDSGLGCEQVVCLRFIRHTYTYREDWLWRH